MFSKRARGNGRGTPKIAQLEATFAPEHVLELDVPVRDGGDAPVHVPHALAHLHEDRQDLALRERPLLPEALVQDVQQRAPGAQLHHDDRLLVPVDDRREGALQLDDVLVPRKDFL